MDDPRPHAEELSAEEWEALAKHAETEAWIAEQIAAESEDSERWEGLRKFWQEKARTYRASAAYEEQVQTDWEETTQRTKN
jgi:uncharacterized lipoprotein